MSRVQLALNVDDLDAAVGYYARQDKVWVDGCATVAGETVEASSGRCC